MRLLIMMVLVLGFSSLGLAQTDSVRITGIVIDHLTRESIVGVNVELSGSSLRTQTNFDGEFMLTISQDPNADSVGLKFSCLGYLDKELVLSIKNGQNHIAISLTIAPSSVKGVMFNSINYKYPPKEKEIIYITPVILQQITMPEIEIDEPMELIPM